MLSAGDFFKGSFPECDGQSKVLPEHMVVHYDLDVEWTMPLLAVLYQRGPKHIEYSLPTLLKKYVLFKISTFSGCWWLTPVILTTQEADIRRIMAQSQPQGNSS
jgi:hypothetical protein